MKKKCLEIMSTVCLAVNWLKSQKNSSQSTAMHDEDLLNDSTKSGSNNLGYNFAKMRHLSSNERKKKNI